MKEQEEKLYRREAALTQAMAIERQPDGAHREADLISLASTFRNTPRNSNVGLSSKSMARLKEETECFNNEG
jgi:hypothetical protein